MNIALTDHARSRIKQRGIPEFIIEGLLTFGKAAHDHKGSEVIYFDRKARKRLRRLWGEATYRRLETKLDAYAVVGDDGAIITVGHRTRRIIHH